MRIINRKSIVVSCVLACIALLCGKAMAIDVLEVYRKSQANDAQYQAALMRFKGDALTLDISQSRYRPNVQLTWRAGRNDYESGQLDASRLDVSGCIDLACIVNRVNQLNAEGTNSTYDSRQSALLLVQPVYDASLLADNKKAEAFIEKSMAELQDAEKELIMRVVADYLKVLASQDEQSMLEAQMDSVQKIRLLAEKRFQLGVGKEREMYDAQAAHDALDIAHELAQGQMATALQQLSNTAGMTITAVNGFSETLQIEHKDNKSIDEWLRLARENNDVLQAAKAFEQVSYFDMKSRKSAAIPKVNFAASYIDDEFSGGRGFSPESTVMAYGIEMKWPIYQGGGISAAGKQAAFRHEESRERVRQVQQDIELGVKSMLLAIEADTRRFAAAQRLVQSSATIEAIAKKAWQNGSGTILEWFEAQKAVLEARRNLSRVRYDYIGHRLALQRLVGELSVKDIEAVNAWIVPAQPAD